MADKIELLLNAPDIVYKWGWHDMQETKRRVRNVAWASDQFEVLTNEEFALFEKKCEENGFIVEEYFDEDED